MAEKTSIILFSGAMDKLMAGSIISSGAVANGMDVDIFVTFWALLQLKKNGRPAPTLSPDAGNMAGQIMQVMAEKKIPSWLDTLKKLQEIGTVNVYACAMFADLMGIKKNDLDPIVKDIIGVSQFVDMARESKMTLFL
ncbi:MAG: DsrE/DsrF/DrsH-like family protein [Candidatus Thermoplasmatota archaeon]|jgi:peroxiredoxin family protein|nr:DsrE/DsrF/DrsH-like family protein [Candidatus Thermoplasmatota archaeon]MCL5785593.1 DsrE/DsrF/DrsH-like family protein [Candidatus Thermoplasmatota archaeon]